MTYPPVFARIAAVMVAMSVIAGAYGQCRLKIIELITCDETGHSHIPSLGERAYGLRVDWQVIGTAKGPYDVKFDMADRSWTWKNVNALTPGMYEGIAQFRMPLDGKIPISAVIDPDRRSGNTDLAGTTAESSFLPTPPSQTIQFYGPKKWRASQTMTVTIPRSSGIAMMSYVMGRPTTETFERVLDDAGVADTKDITTLPYGYRIFRRQVPNPAEGTVALSHNFEVECSNVKGDLAKGMESWAAYGDLPAEIRTYLMPESIVESDSPSVRAFVADTLGKNFRKSMTPYEAAKKLFVAVATRLTYVTPADAHATAGLKLGKGDCGTYASLYTASLRSIGIPARNVCGWRSGTDRWHCWVETYVPRAGWMPQDPTDCQTTWIQNHTKGGYAYFFACMPDLNSRVVVSRCSTYTTDDGTWQTMQPGQWGIDPDGAKAPTWSSTCSLTAIN